MSEKAGGAKRNTTIADSLDRFIERVRDEPEHASDFAEKIAAEFTNGLYDHKRICRKCRIVVVLRFCHVPVKLPHFAGGKSDFLAASPRMAAIVSAMMKKFFVQAI